MKKIRSFTIAAFLYAWPALGLASDYCPDTSEIAVQNGHFVAVTSAGKWVSEDSAAQADLSTLVFWQAKGMPVGNTGSSAVKVNNLICSYFSITSSFAVFLHSPGYPSQTFLVQKQDNSWGLYAEGFMGCLSANQSITDCPFNKI